MGYRLVTALFGVWMGVVGFAGLAAEEATESATPVETTESAAEPAESTEPAEESASTPAAEAGEAGDVEKVLADPVSWEGKVISIPVKGPIMGAPFSDMDRLIISAIDRADRQKAKLILLELDTPGGSVDACDRISNRLLRAKTPTAALVLHKAVSGGALLALGCQEIAMCEGARMGDAQPMLMSPTGDQAQMDDRMVAKIESDLRGLMKALAEKHSRPPMLFEAMISKDIELYKVDFEDGAKDFLTKDQLALLEANVERGRDPRRITDTKLISEKGHLLEMSPREALDYGAADLVTKSREDYFALKEIAFQDIVLLPLEEASLDPSKLLEKMLPKMPELPGWVILLLAVCLIVGIAGIATEFSSPGFGIPGAAGLIGFASFFAILMMHDRGSWLGITLFVIGLALLIVEIVVLPGFGIPGILGIAAILMGLFFAYAPPMEVGAAGWSFMDVISEFVPFLLVVIVAAGLLCWLVISYGKYIPGFGRLFMRETLRTGKEVWDEVHADAVEEWKPRGEHVGQTGVAETDLRPSGKVRLDSGKLGDARTRGDFIEKGRRVKVLDEQLAAWVVEREY